ncbi:MAG: amidase [Proteobacteria bacterium]|nr:amidase [Pseudomonadota bacterium]
MNIYEMSACSILKHLEARDCSAEEVLNSHFNRIEELNADIGAVVHLLKADALKRASASDKRRAQNSAFPLDGLPISVKENIETQGLASTMGVRSRKNIIASKDAVLVKAFKDLGAIPHIKTNIPELLLSFECHNTMWGTTLNPWNRERAPGGSSGGEAAAIAAGFSPLGLGTDIGGSIRIPAAWCGIAGIKPTYGYWSMKGIVGAIKGQEIVRAQAGPMARHVEDLHLALCVLSPKIMGEYDPRTPPLSMSKNFDTDVEGLRIGFYEDDGFFEPAQSIKRAVQEAKEALEKRGAILIPYKPPKSWELIHIYFSALSADGALILKEQMKQQRPIVQLQSLFRIASLPSSVRALTAKTMKLRGEKRLHHLLTAIGKKEVHQLWRLTEQRTKLQREEMELWREHDLDILIGPPVVTPAALHGETGDWSLGAYHTMRYNLLDLPAGVVPFSKVKQEETKMRSIEDRLTSKAAFFEKNSVGMPLSVQVIGKPWQESKVLKVMGALEEEAKKRNDFPLTPVQPERRK